MIITPGTTDVTIEILVVDDASLPVTGLVAATLPDIYYSRAGETLPSALTLSDLAAQDSAHSDGGVKELSVGRYRLDLPDAACATATLLYVFGEETGKRVICEPIVVATIGTSTFDHASDQVIVGTNNDKNNYGLSSSAIQAIYDFATASIAASGSFGKYVLDSLASLLTRLTSSRAGYLDNLNVGGAVASQADIEALNQSASRRVLLVTVGQYERPESGSVTYTVEARTFDADGAAVAADSNPTLTGTGSVTGSLAANIGSISNPSTGVYRWEYTVASAHNQEQIRFDLSATIASSTFTLSTYTQVVDLVAATWTSSDASKLTAIYDKLPSADYLVGTASSAGTGYSTHSAADVLSAINANATQITLQTNAANAASSASTAATQATTAATQATAAQTAATSAATAASGAKTSADTVAAVLDDLTELNASVYRFTTAALAQAPGGESQVQVTVSAASVAAQAATDGGKIRIRTHSTFRAQITGLGSLSGRSDLLFALKTSVDDTDDEAELLISENVGLLRVSGESAADATKASLTVDDADTGDVTIYVDESITAALTPRNRRPWSIKVITSAGDANELTSPDIDSTHADVIRGIARTYTSTS